MMWKSLVCYDCLKTGMNVIIINGLSEGTCEEEDCKLECRYNTSFKLSAGSVTEKNSLSSVGAVIINSAGGFVVGGHCVSRSTVVKVKNVIGRNPAISDHAPLCVKEMGVDSQTVRVALRVLNEFKKEGVAIA